MNLRVLKSDWTPFVEALCERTEVETAGIILAERMTGGEVLLAQEMIVLPERAYLIRRSDQIRIDPVKLNRLIRPARDHGWSVLTVHTHPGTTHPWFSIADDMGDARLMPSFFNQMEGPHGSMVIAGATRLPIGRVWSDNGEKSFLQVRSVGHGLAIGNGQELPESAAPWFDRQRLALGDSGQAALRELHVVIVGLGGTGSVVFLQLAHLGVGRITVIDADRVEESNISRILGATVADVGQTWKVDIAARYAEKLGLGTQVRCFRGHFGRDVAATEIEACDLAVSCVDRHLPRALLNRLSYARAMPLIDMGSAFRVDHTGRISGAAGRVVIVGPERPCLACWGHIDPDRVRIESLPEVERTKGIAEGYIDGAEVPQPSVVAFNTAVAGAAVVELLRLVTGFAGMDEPPMRLHFDFSSGAIRRNRLAEDRRCGICLRPKVAIDRMAS